MQHLGKGLDLGIQAALVTSGAVLVDDALVGHAVDHRHGNRVGGLGIGLVAGGNGVHDLLDVECGPWSAGWRCGSMPVGQRLANDPFLFAKRDGLYIILAFCLALITLRLPMEFWQRHSTPCVLIASIIMLLIVLVVG